MSQPQDLENIDLFLDSLPDEHISKVDDLVRNEKERTASLDWLDDVYSNKSESTYDDRVYNFCMYLEWVTEHDVSLLDASLRTVDNYFSHLSDEYSPNTIQSKYYTVKSFYDYLSTNLQYRDDTPFDDLEASKHIDWTAKSKKLEEMNAVNDIHAIESDEVKQLVRNVPEPELRNELIVRLAYQTGMRPNEICNIRWHGVDSEEDDVDLDDRKIIAHDDKTNDSRPVWYQPAIDDLMSEWIHVHRESYNPSTDSNYLFLSHMYEELAPSRINKIVKSAAEEAGIQRVIYEDEHDPHQTGVESVDDNTTFKRVRINSYVLRHSYAVHALRNGIDLKRLSDLMGHKSLDRTRTYLELLDEDKKESQRKYGPSLST